jgi:hypothetical protein
MRVKTNTGAKVQQIPRAAKFYVYKNEEKQPFLPRDTSCEQKNV